jgi:hypothetical protein
LANENDARVLQPHWPHIMCANPATCVAFSSCSHCMAIRDGSLVFGIYTVKNSNTPGKIQRDAVDRTGQSFTPLWTNRTGEECVRFSTKYTVARCRHPSGTVVARVFGRIHNSPGNGYAN